VDGTLSFIIANGISSGIWTRGYELACAVSCVSDSTAVAKRERGTGNSGPTASSMNLDCIALPKPMFVLFNPPRGNTINRRAGCGKSARPVRREGRPGNRPSLPLSPSPGQRPGERIASDGSKRAKGPAVRRENGWPVGPRNAPLGHLPQGVALVVLHKSELILADCGN